MYTPLETQFEYNMDDSHSMRDFHDKFKDQLPLWVMVTEGNDGETQYDDFCSDQALRIHKVCTQDRVIARESNEAVRQSLEFLSIPVKSKLQYCLVEGPNRVGKPRFLEDILKDHEPYFIVRLAPGQKAGFGHTRDGRPEDLLVIKRYVEKYLQGNCLTQEGLYHLPCTACLTPDISVALITGFKGKRPREFERFKEIMDVFVKEKVTFDDEIDNQLVNRYKVGSIEMKGIISSGELFPDTDVYGPPELPLRKGEEVESTYEFLKPDPEWVPPKPPKPKSREGRSKSPSSSHGKPDLPARKSTKVYKRDNEPVMAKEDKGSPETERYVHAGYVTKLMESPSHEDLYCEPKLPKDNGYSVPEHEQDHAMKLEQTACPDVVALSIKELGKKLHQLNLDKYKKKFKHETVDGMLLSQLNGDILKSQFNFTEIEAIRLMTYVKTGHIPH